MGLLSILPAGAAMASTVADSTQAAPRFNVGMQAVHFRFAGLGQIGSNGKPLAYNGLMPSVGYRFNSRWQVEVAAVWRGKKAEGPMTVLDYPNGGLYRYFDTYQSYAVPIVARFSLLPRQRRWGVEAVAGFSILHSLVEGNRSMTEAGQPVQPFQVSGFTEANDLPLALGAALTYAPSKHWTVRGEGRLNWSWMGSVAGAVLFGGVFLPQTGVSAGVQYNFGLGL
ncbi:outer membrane beta-barrel protein [Hymenobacter arizonensis]|nr:outer membrane beta-barrel protein [Hymenobacter arizonensis]